MCSAAIQSGTWGLVILSSSQWRLLSALAALALLALASAFAQSGTRSSLQPAKMLPANMGSSAKFPATTQHTVLRAVTVLRSKSSVEVHIEASASVKPVVKTFNGPERIVIDLAGVTNDHSRRVDINYGDVQDVRVGLFKADPPITRVVVDLAHPHGYRLLPAGKTVILAIDTASGPILPSRPIPTTIPSIPKAVPVPARIEPSVANIPAVSPPVPVSPATREPKQPETPAVSEKNVTAAPAPDVSNSAGLPEVPTVPVTTEEAQLSPAPEEETTPHQAAKGNKPGVVRNVTVSHDKDFIEVRVEGSKPLRASASKLSNPERIIIDLADVRVRNPRHIAVNSGDVRTVDVAVFLVNPLVTRLTVDLLRSSPYRVHASGNSLTLRIGRESVRAVDTQLVP